METGGPGPSGFVFRNCVLILFKPLEIMIYYAFLPSLSSPQSTLSMKLVSVTTSFPPLANHHPLSQESEGFISMFQAFC